MLLIACEKGDLKLVKRLLSMKANPNLANYVSHKPFISMPFTCCVFNSQNGKTPVMRARKLDEKEILQELMDNHANPEVVLTGVVSIFADTCILILL